MHIVINNLQVLEEYDKHSEAHPKHHVFDFIENVNDQDDISVSKRASARLCQHFAWCIIPVKGKHLVADC